jgi:hypothetical protein
VEDKNAKRKSTEPTVTPAAPEAKMGKWSTVEQQKYLQIQIENYEF